MNALYRNVIATLAAAAALLCMPMVSCAQVQRALDERLEPFRTTCTADGGYLMSLFDDDTVALLKYDASLQPLWGRKLQFEHMCRANDGGAYTFQTRTVHTAVPDSALVQVDINKLSADGSVEWTRAALLHDANLGNDLLSANYMYSDQDSSGAVFFGCQLQLYSLLFKFDAAGQPVWAHRFDFVEVNALQPDGSGGCYWTGSFLGDGPLLIGRFASDGTSIFAESIAIDPFFGLGSVDVERLGNVLRVFTRLDGNVGYVDVSDSGVPLQGHAYAPVPPPPPDLGFGISGGWTFPHGETLLIGGHSGYLPEVDFLLIAPDGEPLSAHALKSNTADDVIHRWQLSVVARSGEEMTVYGDRSSTDDIFNITQHSPFLWQVPSDVTALCTPMDTAAFAHLPLPISSMTVTGLSGISTPGMSVVEVPLATMTEHETYTTQDLCGLTQGIVPPTVDSTPAIALTTNLVTAGMDLTVTIEQPVQLRVLDTFGREVLKVGSAAQGTKVLSTGTLPAGTYFLQALSAAGASTLRFTVTH